MIEMTHWPTPLWLPQIIPGFDRILPLLEALGNPHLNIPPTIHVTGTNGKGSTVAFLRAFFEAAGYKVHAYTSPNLVKVNERIRLAGNEIDDEYFYSILEECRLASEKINVRPTYFEGITVAAFLAFSRMPADILIMEVGMGGRLDATNVITSPIACVITPISLDHTEYLGNDVKTIAGEKAGILKTNTVCITSMQEEDAEEVIFKKAEELSIPVIAYGYDWGVQVMPEGFQFMSRQVNWQLPNPKLLGNHQFFNAGTAIATAVLALPEWKISYDHIVKGLQTVYWPARLQQITNGNMSKLLPDGWELWVDGAHNPSGSNVVADWLDGFTDNKPTFFIVGLTKGRDCIGYLTPLLRHITLLSGITVEAEAASYLGSHVTDEAKKLNIKCQTSASIQDAIKLFINSSDTPGRIIACGSLYLAGDIIALNNGYNRV